MRIEIPDVVASAHENLLFNIPVSVRCIFLGFDDEKLIFRAYFGTQFTESDRKHICGALYDTAADCCIQDTECQCIVSEDPFDELEKLPYWLYVPAEEETD